MCGINGVARRDAAVNKEALIRRRDLLTHRGPDDAGIWVNNDERVALAHRRLAIIDLSPAGHQPMPSENGRYAIVFNGEIYNFRELRRELRQQGFYFHSDSDTEVMLAAYQAWGESCLNRVNGMFAFVIYDHGDDASPPSLFFARDRAGKKPFYYFFDGRDFEFASELKAISHTGGISFIALNYYLALGYIPGEHCLVEGVKKLPPAHAGRLDLSTFSLKTWQYWRLPPNQPEPAANGEALADEAGALIEDSVRLRLMADVPVGVLLSGGLDSSLVTAAAAHVCDRPVETFTIALPGSSLDEAHHAQKVAGYFGARHHVMPLDRPSLGLLDGLAPFIDEPIADSSILPAWLVFGLARKQVTVALGGDGGDELFGGYSSYTNGFLDSQRWAWMPPSLMRGIAATAGRLPAGVRGRNRLTSLRGGAFQQHIWGGPYFDEHLRRRLLSPSVSAGLGESLTAPELFLLTLFNQGQDPLDCMTRMDFGSALPDDFLVKVDRASMAHSLEMRSPFLDHRLIEFAFGRVPPHWKVHGSESRRLQRMLAKRWLPADLDINRKQGFSIPINEWLRHEGERGLMSMMEGLPSAININEVRNLVRGHLAGRANGGRLFALIMLAIAMRNITL